MLDGRERPGRRSVAQAIAMTITMSVDSDVRAVIASARARGARTVCVLCPDHNDHRPSLLVSLRTMRARCYALCRGGGWFPLSDFYDGLSMAADEPHRAVPRPRIHQSQRERAFRCVMQYLVSTESQLRVAGASTRLDGECGNWLTQRGLDAECVAPWVFSLSSDVERRLRARFGEDVLKMSGLVANSGRAIFGPGHRALLVCRGERGDVIGAQIAATTVAGRSWAKYASPAGIPPAPFGLDTVSGKALVVVAEGIVDALSVIQEGIWTHDGDHIPPHSLGVVGLCGVGAPISQALRTAVRLAAPGAKFVVAMDPDDAGDRAASLIRSELALRGVRSVARWRGAGDLNAEMLRRLGQGE